MLRAVRLRAKISAIRAKAPGHRQGMVPEDPEVDLDRLSERDTELERVRPVVLHRHVREARVPSPFGQSRPHAAELNRSGIFRSLFRLGTPLFGLENGTKAILAASATLPPLGV